MILGVALILGASRLAHRNYRHGRGDREGALLLAKMVFVVLVLLWILRGHIVPGFQTFLLIILAVSTALFLSGLVFVLYLALEPYVRRYWPQAIISWSRLLSGRIRDPLVGRDILFGVLLGVVWVLVFKAEGIVLMKTGAAPRLYSTDYLVSTRQGLGAWLSQFPPAILGTLQFFFLFLVLKVILKRDWLAAIAFIGIFAAAKTLGSTHFAVEAVFAILVYLIAAVIISRFGLVSLACAIFTVNLLGNVPFTSDSSAWYLGISIFALLSVVALAAWGFYHALGDKPLWSAASE